MNLRDIKPKTLKKLAMECDGEFDEWFRRTGALEFGTNKPLDPQEIWRTAFSKGSSAVLRRVDALKETV